MLFKYTAVNGLGIVIIRKIYRVKTEKQALNMIINNRADILEANLKVGVDAIRTVLDQSIQSEIEV